MRAPTLLVASFALLAFCVVGGAVARATQGSERGVTCGRDALSLPAGQPSERLVAAVMTDRERYAADAPITFTITVSNPTAAPVETGVGVLLPTLQVRSEDGARVWVHPPLPYPLPVGRCIFAPNASVVRTVLWDGRRNTGAGLEPGDPVGPGVYAAVGGLAGIQASGSGPATFTIEPARGGTAPAPSPTPLVVRSVGPTVIPPGATVQFFIPPSSPRPGEPTPRGRPPPISAENRSDRPVTAVYSQFDLQLEAPPGFLVRILPDARGQRANCMPQEGAVVGCGAFTAGPIVFTVVADERRVESVPLARGCTNVVLTWAPRTPARLVAAAVTPPGALESIWWFIPARGRFAGFRPDAPAEVNDYTAVVEPLEAAFLCVREPATLRRPVRGAP